MDALPAVLGRWSVGVQLATVSAIAVFFVFVARGSKLEETKLWALAWVCDACAIFTVFLYAFFLRRPMVPIATGTYAATKTLFVLLLVAGTRNHLRRGIDFWLRPRYAAYIATAWGVLLGALAGRMARVQIAQMVMVGLVMTSAGIWVLRSPRGERSRWLGLGFLAEGLLFSHYVVALGPQLWGGPILLEYARYGSFLDAVAELLIALASLVALQDRIVEDLRYTNDELMASQERLRQLIDLDPLTALMNRRGFRREIGRLESTGAAIVFLDINNFKAINDRFGHSTGDACLKRVARSLTQCFRLDDALFRWGGDEFLVMAPGLDIEGAGRRVDQLCTILSQPEGDIPVCELAVGVAVLPPGGDASSALHEADARMYIDKRRMGLVHAIEPT